MSVSQSLNYLSGAERVEMRAGINSLFEITATNSKTLCCRINTSYDLVVRDEKFGIYRFCINGAELVDHPLTVYISADCTVGMVRNNTIYITENPGSGIPIRIDLNASNSYYIGSNSITYGSDMITLRYTSGTPVTIKALTIAFAIQCALTRNPVTESVPVPLDNNYESEKDVTSSADVQFQAQPIEHKPYKKSIFETVDKDVSIFIRAAGWIKKGNGNFYFVFEFSPPHEILFIVNYYKVKDKWLMKIVDRDGNEQALATGESLKNDLYWQVTHNTSQIGDFSLSKQVADQNVLQSCNNTIHEKYSKLGDTGIFQYFDESNTEVAHISHDMGPLVKLELKKNLMADEKKILLCCAINRAQAVYTIHMRIPRILPISIITCNCDLCEKCKGKGGSAIFHSFSKNLFIRAAGYSRIKNLVYFDAFFETSSYVIHTVECTPRDNQRGIVKLVVKDEWNKVLWTAVQFPQDIFAFYSKKNDLLGYQWKNTIFNSQNQEVMRVETQNYTRHARFQQKPLQMVKFAIFDNNNLLVAVISKDINCTNIYRPRARIEIARKNMLEVVIAIPLAVKINSAVYKIDEWSLPEITYHYNDVREKGKIAF